MSGQVIRYLKRSELDIARWDESIDRSRNGLVYAYSYYLDSMSRHWDALVMGDYEVVMPLTWNRKWGFRYLYQPPFTQQLGIFSANEITPVITTSFLEEVTSRFRFGEIFLNYHNDLPACTKRCNFIIPLERPYEDVYSNYTKDTIKNLKRSQKFSLRYTHDIQLATALNSYRKEYAKRTPHINESDYRRFEKLCSIAQEKKELIVRAAADAGDKLLAVSVLFVKNKRLYLIESTTFAEGRKVEANYFLIDQLIREFAGTGFVLDFEGSDIPGIAHFYANFGSDNQPYFFYRFNHLPVPVRWLKERKIAKGLEP